jgi:hypothetical protein
MKRRLQGLDVQAAAESSMMETAQDFIDLNTQQMYEGKDSQDEQIQPTYKRPRYARVKNQMNPTPGYGVPDLKLSGDFYKGYTLKVDGDQVIEDSDVDYAKYLTERYGVKIWGLNDSNLSAYRTGPFWSVLKQKVQSQLYG